MAGGARAADIARGAIRTEIVLRVEATRGALRVIETAQRIRAEIVAVNDDGTITVRTANGGEADVRLPPRVKLNLQAGQTIELDIPAGQPPRQVTLRGVEALPPAPVGMQPQQAPTQTTQSPPRPPLPTDLRTTIDTARQDYPGPPAAPPAPDIPAGMMVRLVPLPEAALDRLSVMPTGVIDTMIDLRAITTTIRASAALSAMIEPTLMTATATTATTATTTPAPTTEKTALVTPQIWPLSPPQTGITDRMNAIARPVLNLPLRTVALVPRLDFSGLAPVPPFSSPFSPAVRTGLDVRVESVRPPPTPLWFAADTAQTQPVITTALRGTVIALSADHQPVLRLDQGGHGQDNGTFLMPFPTRGAIEGMAVMFHALFPTMAAAPQRPGDPLPLFPQSGPQPTALTLMQGWSWPVMDELLQILPPGAGSAHGAAGQLIPNIIPNLAQPGRVPAMMLFFMAALRGGDSGTWLGDGIQALLRRDASGRGADILARIARDFSGLSRIADQPITQDWRGMAMPLLWQGEVHKINLHYRHQQGRDDDQDRDNPDRRSTRFIFDLHLDRMGDVQLDGLMKGKRLDLVLRTQQPLSPALCAAMRRSCHAALESGGLDGDLHFQGSPGHFVKVTARQPGLGVSA